MKISDVMTPCPYTINSSQSIEQAVEMMTVRGIRHLPVVENGELLGILTEQYIKVAKTVCDTSGYCPLVGEICQKDPLVAESDATVADVATEMAKEKAEVALIADSDGNFLGIFTTNDACRVLAMLFEERETLCK
ncbi:MAG: CBS domain-containing protein [Bdellovibrionales bacterium]|nr:CBS domain-containing protein [Bdellovibrionales bacterium]